MAKKKYKIIICIFMIVIIVISSIYYFFLKETSVMEQMYKMAKAEGLQIFNKVSALENVSQEDVEEFENFGGLSIHYREEHVKENVKVKLFFLEDEDIIKIKSVNRISDTTLLIMHISYNNQAQTLTYEPISISHSLSDDSANIHYYDKENINKFLKEYNISENDISEYQEYVVYDVVMKTWLDTHGGNFDRAKKKMEELKVDHTFNFSEE